MAVDKWSLLKEAIKKGVEKYCVFDSKGKPIDLRKGLNTVEIQSAATLSRLYKMMLDIDKVKE